MPNPIRVATLLDATSTVEAFVVEVEPVCDVRLLSKPAHVVGGFVHVDHVPLFGSTDSAKLREIAARCADLADRLDAARTFGAGR